MKCLSLVRVALLVKVSDGVVRASFGRCDESASERGLQAAHSDTTTPTELLRVLGSSCEPESPRTTLDKVMRISGLLILLLSALVVSAASRALLNGVSQASEGDQEEQHQRILAELEEVHQLRERMLQQAATYTSSGSGAPAPAPATAYSTGTGASQLITGGTSAGPALAGTGGTSTTSSAVSGATVNGGA
ncbi:hypothetical protein WJX79_009590 [Trebouxia sp. C0005]